MTCGRAGLILITIIFSFGYAERKKRLCPLRTWLAVRGRARVKKRRMRKTVVRQLRKGKKNEKESLL